MYWNIFDKDRYELLKKISEVVSIDDYYMIGGTALSLQLGLRESYDFDFCVKREFNNEIILSELKSIENVEVIQNQKGTCDVLLNGVKSMKLKVVERYQNHEYPIELLNQYGVKSIRGARSVPKKLSELFQK